MNEVLNSRIWISDGTTYHYPEQDLPEIQQKLNVAICMSGGGNRAMSASMGQLRALENLGYLDKIRYLSCVSGGSWASTIYTYYQSGPKNDQELLGPVTSTKDITEAHLQNSLNPKNLAYPASSSMYNTLKTLLEEKLDPLKKHTYNYDEIWIIAIGENYLAPFGMYNQSGDKPDLQKLRFFSYDHDTLQSILRCNPNLKADQFLLTQANRPFLVINSSVLPTNDAEAADLLSFEYTPLSIGRPYLSTAASNGQQYGGGFIEPFAFRGLKPSQITSACDPSANTEIEVAPKRRSFLQRLLDCRKRKKTAISADLDTTPFAGTTGYASITNSDRPQNISDATGTSSFAVAEILAHIASDLGSDGTIDPQSIYWPVTPSLKNTDNNTFFGDAGLLDNYGLISMIQRGVKTAIVFINTDAPLKPGYVASSERDNDPKHFIDESLPALFGFANSHWSYTYPTNQVFPSSDCQQVVDALYARQSNGEALIVTTTHDIQPNSYWGIPSGMGTIDVIWCYLGTSSHWESQLPKPVQNDINQGKNGGYAHFPNYKTFNQNAVLTINLTPQQITLLADFTCNIILDDKNQTIKKALEAATTKTV